MMCLAQSSPTAFFSASSEDQVLAHGFGGAAGLGDDVEAGGLYVDYVKQRGHALGVDVVLDIQAGAAALFGGQLVIVQVVQCLLHGDGAAARCRRCPAPRRRQTARAPRAAVFSMAASTSSCS